LGKGLESLIPPKKGGDNAGQGDNSAFLPQQNGQDLSVPELDAPQIPEELPSAFDSEEQEEPGMILDPFSPSVEPEPSVLPPLSMSPSPPIFPSASSAPAAQHKTTGRKDKEGRVSDEDRIFHIEVEKISPNPGQPRRVFDEAALRELAFSIREFGFLQPLVVTKKEIETLRGIDVQYELIAGERRLMAAKLLGLSLVPAIIKSVGLEREKLEMAVIENIQRENLNPMEVARSFQRLQEEFRLTQREIAAKLGKSREAVANTVRLLDLPQEIQEALEQGKISESHGRLLLSVDDPGAQKKLFDDLLHIRLTTRELKERVRAIKPEKPEREKHDLPEFRIFENKLSMELGTPVKIERGGSTGKIMITFYSDEELRNIIEKFSGPEE